MPFSMFHAPSEAIDPAVYHDRAGRLRDQIREPEVLKFLDTWCTNCKGRAMPSPSDIDPIDFVWAMSRMFIGDYDRDRDRFTYRVAGEEVVAVFQKFSKKGSMRGVSLGEGMAPDKAALLKKRWRPLAERGDVIFMSGTVYMIEERYGVGERLVLPLSDNGTEVTGFVGFTKCQWSLPGEPVADPHLDIWYFASDELI